MPQINFHTTDEFERDLLVVMSSMRMFGKSKAIRFAVHEMAEAFRQHEARSVRERNASGSSRKFMSRRKVPLKEAAIVKINGKRCFDPKKPTESAISAFETAHKRATLLRKRD
jgi:hypothetical protein